MKITIESTDTLIWVADERSGGFIPGRLWVGKTEGGIEIQCVVTRVAVAQNEDLAQFQRELLECRPPAAAVSVFPLRMVI